eukprot:9848771-Alexandrium_andersonii.AAC.1
MLLLRELSSSLARTTRGPWRAGISPADTVGLAAGSDCPNLGLHLNSLRLKVVKALFIAPPLKFFFEASPTMKGQ